MADINPRYAEYSMAVAEELKSNGYVLLGDAFVDPDSLADTIGKGSFVRDDIPDMHRVSRGQTPEDIVEAIRSYVSSLGSEVSVAKASLLRIGKGDFTLQHDDQPPPGLHAVLFFCPDGWDAELRGEVTYVPPDAAPLLLVPEDNSLALVNSGDEWRVFIKRVNHFAEDISFYVLHIAFRQTS